MKSVLIICTGNSCRSPMAEGIIKTLFRNVKARSAGINPESRVTQYAVDVMKEIGIDIGSHIPVKLDPGLIRDVEILITLSPSAKDEVLKSTVAGSRHFHLDIRDPMEATGSEEEIRRVYRNTRDELIEKLENLFRTNTIFE